MELLLLTTALLCWLGYIIGASALLIWNGKPAGGMVCVYMGSQADVAEWFVRSLYKIDGVLTGRLNVAVAVDPSGDDTARIISILSAEKEFPLIEYPKPQAVDKSVSGHWVLDVRGMDKRSLLAGPLEDIKGYRF